MKDEKSDPKPEKAGTVVCIYAVILFSLECQYRQYETMDMYEWASEMLAKQVNMTLVLKEIKFYDIIHHMEVTKD